MGKISPQTDPDRKTNPWTVLAAAALCVFLLVALYDPARKIPPRQELLSLIHGPSVRDFQPAWKPLWPPHGVATRGRPLANLSFAVNRALAEKVFMHWSFRRTNIFIHILSFLFLFGILRRTFLAGPLSGAYAKDAFWLSLGIGFLWAVHPVHSEAVLNVSRRPEPMMGLFLLGCFYCALRAWPSPRPGIWKSLCLLFFLLGVLSHEAILAGPLLILVYDRTFVHGSFARAFKASQGLYLGLALLAALGLGLALAGASGMGPGLFARTGPWAFFWKWPLAAALYSWPFSWRNPAWFGAGPGLFPVQTIFLCLFTVLAYAAVRRLRANKASGFGLAWFFLLAAPWALVYPRPDMAGEHRLYLALAAPMAFLVLALYGLLFKGAVRRRGARMALFGALMAALVILVGIESYIRIYLLETRALLLEKTLSQKEQDIQAHFHLANTFFMGGRYEKAVGHFKEILKLDPDSDTARYNLANTLARLGRIDEAIYHYNRTLELTPGNVYVRNNLAVALIRRGEHVKARQHIEIVLEKAPDFGKAHENMGLILEKSGHHGQAVLAYSQALKYGGYTPSLYRNLGRCLGLAGKWKEAMAHFEEAVKSMPDDPVVRTGLARALWNMGYHRKAIEQFEKARDLLPENPDVLYNLGFAYLNKGRRKEARLVLEKVVALDPGNSQARTWLEVVEKAIDGGTK